MNKVILMGRLTRDAEVRYSQGDASTAVARFSLAVDRRFRREGEEQTADFIGCVAFGKTAEFIERFGRKGTKFVIEGRIQTGNYTNKDGQTIYTTDVAVEKVEFVGSKSDNSASTVDAVPVADKPVDKPKRSSKAAPAQPQADEFISIPDSIDDIPFVN